MVEISLCLIIVLTGLAIILVYAFTANSIREGRRKAKRFELYRRMLLHLEDIYAREALGYEDEGPLGFCFMISILKDSEDLPSHISNYPELWAYKPDQNQIGLYGGFWWQSDDRISRINVLKDILHVR